MQLSISASTVKNWFQYRCERKLVYETMSRAVREAVPIEEDRLPAPWADFGNEYERRVIQAYARQPDVELRRPPATRDHLGETASWSFLEAKLGGTAAHQLVLTGSSSLRELLEIGDLDLAFRRGLVDLLLARDDDGRRVLRLVDVKSTHEALSFHKTQVAWYALMLRGLIAQNGLEAEVDSVAEIWHRPRGSETDSLWQATPFRLRPYESVIIDWAGRN